jgi:hypothetical protein
MSPTDASRQRCQFLTPTAFAVSTAAWLALAVFVWTRDFVLVGTDAHGLQRTAIILMVQSMVLWGLFSPFILVAAQRLDFERGRRLRSAVLHIVFALFLAAADVLVDLLISNYTHLEDGTFAKRFYGEVFINCFSYVAVAAIGYALVYQQRLSASRMSALELQRELVQARLDVLARTLQPHFLFNAMNTVAALVRLAENKRALSAVVALSDLLRVVLKTGGAARVPLTEELGFIDRYVAIEQLRFEDRLQVEKNIESGAGQLLVPALILQPLVENAIRHGVEVSGHGCVHIDATATPEALTLLVKVKGRTEAADPRVSGLGIGLDVTRRRLAYLYGDGKFALDLLVGCGHSSVTLRIPREEILYVRADPDSHRG